MKTKTKLLSVATFVAMSWTAGADVQWTHQKEQGEDATSTHYYFAHSIGPLIDRVRWVWNGGATNNPTVTEYTITAGKITIRHFDGKRESIPKLVAGRDAELKLTFEHSITAKNIEKKLLSAAFEKPLTKRQRTDLKNLQDLLVELGIRKPKRQKAQK